MSSAVHAPVPGMTLNIDLCYVPVTHSEAEAVPGSTCPAGEVIVQPAGKLDTAKPFAGMVFEDSTLAYEQQMEVYHEARITPQTPPEVLSDLNEQSAEEDPKLFKKICNQKEDQLQLDRSQQRDKRKKEDMAFKAHKQAFQAEQKRYRTQNLPERKEQKTQNDVLIQQFKALKQAYQQLQPERQKEDKQWREARAELRQLRGLLPAKRVWIAVLLIIDNCSRKVYGLPVFSSGANVTAKEVTEAILPLLPQQLQYLISDRGVHFTADCFNEALKEKGIKHILTPRKRPQTNGTVERLVRTYKEWLKSKTWNDHQEIEIINGEFVEQYNDRPHQAKQLKGFSPNYFEVIIKEKSKVAS